MIADPKFPTHQIRFDLERIEKWSATIFTQQDVFAVEDEVVNYTDLTCSAVVGNRDHQRPYRKTTPRAFAAV